MTMTTADVASSSSDDGVMGPRVDRPKRRRFTAEYKATILAEYDAAEHGARGAVLRREGLYSSHIIEWRRAAQAGAAAGLAPATRDRRERERDREVAQLRARAEKAEDASIAKVVNSRRVGGEQVSPLATSVKPPFARLLLQGILPWPDDEVGR